MEDTMQLGGNIELNGFGNLQRAEMVVLKKIVGNYAKTMSEKNTKFAKLKVSMSKNAEYKISAEMTADKIYAEEKTGNNLFITLDSALKEIVSQL